ncbi:MAG: aminotransferase class III-fold pyridoxal phosphate-dependent enzyme [Burkholderiaceae bacterium]
MAAAATSSPPDPALAQFALASRYLPGGVCASARSNNAIGHPFFVSRGDGAYLYDLQDRPYLDMSTSHGASLLGHNHPRLKAAVQQALDMGIVCSAETVHHARLAQRITELVPCAEMVRFGGSGTETVMHGLRLARCATGREKLIKFEGHFHGYSDALNYSVMPPLDQAGPSRSPTAYAESDGVPRNTREHVIVLPFNDPRALEKAFAEHGSTVAALLLEPINYDQGCVMPQPGFLALCRDLCDRHGCTLFFDEVLTAFRVGLGGAQQLFGVTPDLCVLGKAFGAGMPISALAGRRKWMAQLQPLGRSQMSGTFLAHLTAVLAAQAALDEYDSAGFYDQLAASCAHFYTGFEDIIARSGVTVRLQHCGPRFGLYFGVAGSVVNYRQAAARNLSAELQFVRACFERGVYFQPAAHHGFSAVHGKADLDKALTAIEGALDDMRHNGVDG